MEFKIISDIENNLFNRREIEGEIYTDVAPKREEVADTLADALKVPAEKIKIKTIMAKFGSRVFVVVANIYDSEEIKNNIERQSKKEKAIEEKRKKQIEESVKEDKPTESQETEPIAEQQTEDKIIEEIKE